jgi:hypothetical protein
MLKSQDILVAMKLASLALAPDHPPPPASLAWQGWDDDETGEVYDDAVEAAEEPLKTTWTYAEMSAWLKLSASECNGAVKRGTQCGLIRLSRGTQRPVAHIPNLLEFLVHGLKFIYPIIEGRFTRGIPTAFAAPVLASNLMSAGTHIYVWPDARGKETGLSVEPIHKSLPFAVRFDPVLYELAALTDAIRFGKPREADLAIDQLAKTLKRA